MKRIAPCVVLAALAGSVSMAKADLPILRLWPGGDSPCDTTLQACVSGANPGDGIRIETDGPIDESITFSKALALTAQPGFHPVFSSSHSIIAATSTSGDQTIRIEGLSFQDGYIEILQETTGVMTAQVADNRVRTSNGSLPAGISVFQFTDTGPVSFDISGNLVLVAPSTPNGPTGIHVNLFGAIGTVDHNQITVDPGEATGIWVSGSVSEVDVIANRIAGTGYDCGIHLDAQGTTVARILDNLVTGQAGQVACPGAISIYASDALQATVANNTLAYDGEGVFVQTLGSSSLVIANNALTDNTLAGLSLDLDRSTTLAQDHNLFYANGVDIALSPVMPGPHSVFANPHYAGPGDYRIVAPSQAIDAGDDSAVPSTDIDGNPITDLDGSPRIQGSHVDIGAYEAAPEPREGLGGAVALLALSTLRSRARGRGTGCGARLMRRLAGPGGRSSGLLLSILLVAVRVQAAIPVGSPVVGWGSDYYGQATPPDVVNTAESRFFVAAGTYHSCAIVGQQGTLERNLVCWGRDDEGQIDPPPSAQVAVGLVAAGTRHTCAMVGFEHSVVCWGHNDRGQATPPAELETKGVITIALGGDHSCAIEADYSVTCWGSNYYSESTPPAGLHADALAVGDFHACALDEGAVVCWGDTVYGESSPPDSVNGTTGFASAISAGNGYSCAIQAETGAVVCWGYDSDGQTTVPDAVNGTTGTAIAISAGLDHSCAIQAGTNDVVCWGDDTYGQATPPSSLHASAIAAGGIHTLAIQIPEPGPSMLSLTSLGALLAVICLRRRSRSHRSTGIGSRSDALHFCHPEDPAMKRLLLAGASCAYLWSIQAEAICLPIVCGPPPPTLWIWGDGNASCPTTLQDCIDQAAPGDVVRIDTDEPIDESISFQKSLTLRAGSGHTPVFAVGRSINAPTPATGANSITIEGLTLLGGTISVIQESVGSLDAAIVGNTTLDAQEVGINLNFIFAGTGDVTFDISNNTVGVPAYREDDVGIDAGFNGNATGRIANNSIVMGEASNGYAIDLYDAAGSLDVDVIANHLSGTNYDTGIGVVAGEGGAAEVRILDNLVTGQGGNAGLTGAIALEADAPGPFAATVVNNTVADGEIGIATRGNLMTGLVANNIVTNNTTWGIRIDPPNLANSNNLVFGNATDPFTPGPGTVTLDPLFVSVSDFLLQPGSPAIDAGDDGSVPADLTTDLDGNPRIQGSHVDIGAYETAPEPAAVLDSVGALLALTALGRRTPGESRGRRRSRTRRTLWIPLLVIGLLNSAIAAADEGPVVGWGRNSQGQATPPVSVNGTSGTASAIAAGLFHSCAIQTGTGAVVCWGEDSDGQASPPDAVNGAAGVARAVASGYSHSCAIQIENGSVWCWGSNGSGQTSVPAALDGPDGRALAITAGGNHNCGIRVNKFDPWHVVCWGSNSYGESAPADSVRAVSIAAGGFHTCAIDPTGAVVCWGSNGSGESTPPDSVNGAGGTASAIAAGVSHTCAIQTGSGAVVCWGFIGPGEPAVPTAVDGTHGSAVSISAGGYYSCAIQAGSFAVVCWGSNDSGALTPPVSLRASSISAGGSHSLAIAAPEASALSSAAGATTTLALLRRAGRQRIRRSRAA
ncbi:MAG TPA: choice-of-anchor Q domain-containing protein [Solirubrobacteraceae bacterium]|nr:choice-of-anchor Q domain-containing protein [Solirubrobacteraceae bacterium]